MATKTTQLFHSFLLFLAVLFITFSFGDYATAAPMIIPGAGVSGDFSIGENGYEATQLLRQRLNKPIISSQGPRSINTKIGVRLFTRNNGSIWQIVIFNASLFTQRRIHVFSSVDQVLFAYGRNYQMKRIRGGYYLFYPNQGIGFDISGVTDTVRAIVIF